MITVLFTIRKWNLISWLIRWVVPRSRFALAESSHCVILYGDRVIEANMLYGVREVDREVALKGCTVVRTIRYNVPDAYAGITWARAQVRAKKRYDWRGALGLGLTPHRVWAEDDRWYCFEFAAAVLRASGRPVFANLNHIGEVALMAITP